MYYIIRERYSRIEKLELYLLQIHKKEEKYKVSFINYEKITFIEY